MQVGFLQLIECLLRAVWYECCAYIKADISNAARWVACVKATPYGYNQLLIVMRAPKGFQSPARQNVYCNQIVDLAVQMG